MRKLIIGTAGLLVGIGLELGDFRSRIVSVACLAVAAFCYLWLLCTWHPVASRLPSIRVEWPARRPGRVDDGTRVKKMQEVLLEAARSFRERRIPTDVDATIEKAVRYYTMLVFLTQGFAHRVKPDFDAFMRAEEQKTGGPRSPLDGPTASDDRVARYLEDLAKRLKADDLDDGFLIPDKWSQYDAWSWPKNTRT